MELNFVLEDETGRVELAIFGKKYQKERRMFKRISKIVLKNQNHSHVNGTSNNKENSTWYWFSTGNLDSQPLRQKKKEVGESSANNARPKNKQVLNLPGK